MKTLADTTRGVVRYGEVAEDGSRLMYVLPTHSAALRCIGKLMPAASAKTLEASPGIQKWSNPRGKVATKLFDGGASIASFSAYWEKHWQSTYPLATPQS